MSNGFAIAVAWPETYCKQAGAWYDKPLYYAGINKNGKYKVGHTALVLVENDRKECHYFDFGRYHAPHGFGRVRNAETDHDLTILTKAKLTSGNSKIINLYEILEELHANPSTHGTGTTYGASVRINFNAAYHKAKELQNKEFIPYGPFVAGGTNCSRFVNTVILAGKPSLSQAFRLRFPLTITPSPMGNLRALQSSISVVSSRIQDTLVPAF